MNGDEKSIKVDPWGEEPSWARKLLKWNQSKQAYDSDDSQSSSSSSDELTEKSPAMKAQHTLILIDMNPAMFHPCIPVTKKMKIMPLSTTSNVNNNGQRSEYENEKFYVNTMDEVRCNNDMMISPFDAALLACEKLVRHQIKFVATSSTGKRDGIGVLLYGTCKRTCENSKSTQSKQQDKVLKGENDDESSQADEEEEDEPMPTTYELLPLKVPSIDHVLRIRECLPSQPRNHGFFSGGSWCLDGKRKRDLEEEFVGRDINYCETDDKDGIEMNTLLLSLRESLKIFNHSSCIKRASKTSTGFSDEKMIWIFSCNDNPGRGNAHETDRLLVIARDILDHGIDIHLFPLPLQSIKNPFDSTIFYSRISLGKDIPSKERGVGSVNIMKHSIDDLSGMLNEIGVRSRKFYKIQSIPLLLPDWRDRPEDSSIMLDVYPLVQTKRKPVPITVHQDTFKKTNRITDIIVKETGAIISREDLQHYFEIGDSRVPITPKEVAFIKRNATAGNSNGSLVLVGFKSKNPLLYNYLIDKTLFAYPNESLVPGSKRAFAALHASMIRKNVMGIGEYLSRLATSSRMVAILPQCEEELIPAGFLIVPLPYQDDIRVNQINIHTNTEVTTIEAAVAMIQGQNIQQELLLGKTFANPVLQDFWNYIESVALDMPLQKSGCEEVGYETAYKSNAALIESFLSSLPEDGADVKEWKRRMVKVVPDETGIDWQHAYRTDSLDDFKIPQLKAYLRSVGASVSGKKSDLIARVKENMRASSYDMQD